MLACLEPRLILTTLRIMNPVQDLLQPKKIERKYYHIKTHSTFILFYSLTFIARLSGSLQSTSCNVVLTSHMKEKLGLGASLLLLSPHKMTKA
jgi:predicted P-loop ATPase/GTPase